MPYETGADAPLILEDPDMHHLVLGEAQVKDATVHYFSHLYHHAPPAHVLKPWLQCASIQEVRAHVSLYPFKWPHSLTLDKLQSLLHHGNPHLAPRPDGWEKWCIKALCSTALSVVLHLLNFEILHSTIPPFLRDTTLVTLHK